MEKPDQNGTSPAVTETAAFDSGVYTIPQDQPFLAAVAKGILDQTGNDPLKLSDITLLVPDAATGQALRQAFLDLLEGKPVVLPRIDTPGSVDEDQLSLKLSSNNILSQTLMDIPPPVSRLERQLILATEIMKIPGMSSSHQKAIKLASELGRLLDILQRAGVELGDIDKLAPSEFQQQWSKTADFLKIITDVWPRKLAEMGRIDPEDRRNALMQIQAAHWIQHPPAKPVYAVGFTDTSPAAVAVLQAVSLMEKGSIIIPGLDTTLDEKSWQAVTPVHPQYIAKKILSGLGLGRADVRIWQGMVEPSSHARANNPQRTSAAREILLQQALKPASTTDSWSSLKTNKRKKADAAEGKQLDIQALNGMDLLICGTPQEEASVIALKMRETLEVPGRRAMLVTADRSLARRVSARLRHWNISVEDSAGRSLSDTPAGIFLLATAQMGSESWAPISLLEVLKHPLSGLGLAKSEFRARVSDIENLTLHGPRPAAGAEGLKESLTAAFNRAAHRKATPAAPTKTPEELAAQQKALEETITQLQTAGAAFFAKMSSTVALPFREFIDAHIAFVENLAADDKKPGRERVWTGDDGQRAARVFTKLRESADCLPPMLGRDYIDVLRGLLHEENIKSRENHPALKIVTPQQAMLEKSDIVILGGLNDGTWPQAPAENPWLSPDMLKKLGVPAPDEVVGLSGLQFTQLVSNTNVLMTRSERSGNAPTVASPFLTRLQMVLKGAGLGQKLEGKSRLLDIHNAIHTPSAVTPIDAPAPTPPVTARPKELPVTAIEALMRDPYSVYAKYVLKLRRLSPLDAGPSVAEKGNFTHEALDDFVKKYPDKLPPNAKEELLKMGAETFKSRMGDPSVRSFWWPRFQRIAEWFVKFETARREVCRTLGTEVRGKLEIDMGGGEVFTLTTIADRVDMGAEDKLNIIDYKTGAVPLQKAVALGFSPQLTLEALIATTGGFKMVDANEVGSLQYWKLSGARPAGEVIEVKGDVATLIAEAREGIEKLMRAFNDPKTPYLSTPRPEWAPRYQNYEHLARAGEWAFVKKTDARKKAPKTATRNTGKGGGRKS